MKNSYHTVKINNLGLQLLKMILCFWVVLIHTIQISNKILYKLLFIRKFHVPTFFLMSFFFVSKSITERNIPKIKSRFERLFIPYLFLPLIIWIVNNVIYIFYKFNRFGRILTIKDLFIQYLIGHSFHRIFWFQFNLIFITLIFFILSFLFKKRIIFILHLSIIISYLLQYSGYNTKLFMEYNYLIKFPLENIVEVFPCCVYGFFFGFFNIIKIMNNNQFKIIFFSIIYIYFLFYFDIFIEIKVYYGGLLNNIGSIFLFICFSLIPFKINKSNCALLFIKLISNYTGGIYYFHKILLDNIKSSNINVKIFRNKSFTKAIIIYLISYIICYIGIKIFGKTKLKYIFI